MIYLKIFNQHSEYETYINGSDKILPNLSYCENEDDVHFNAYVIPPCNITITGSDGASLDVTELEKGKSIELKLNVEPNYYIETIQILMGNTDITSTAWNQLQETITINNVTDDINITITTSSTQQDRGYLAPLRIMNNNGVMSTGRLYFAVNTAVGTGSTVLCKPALPNWLSYSSEYIGGNAGDFVQDYFYTTTAFTTTYGYRKVSCSETVPIGKYKLPFSWQTENSTTWYQSNSVIEVVPYERKVLNGTDTEIPYDEFDLDSRDVTINKTFVAGEWTPFFVPFDLSENEVKQVFGDDVQIASLDNAVAENGILKIYLTTDTPPSMYMNYPQFIKSSRNLTNVNFDDVVIDIDSVDAGFGRGSKYKSVFLGFYTVQYSENPYYILKNDQITSSNILEAYDCYVCLDTWNCNSGEIYVDNQLIAESVSD